jgi:hypothetical protein
MFGLLLIALSTSLGEASESIGKNQVNHKLQSLYAMAFLSSFFSIVFFGITLLFGAPFRFQLASLPFFMPRLFLELLLSYLTVSAIVKADRSTFSFARLVTIPLLLLVDLRAHYAISILQVAGILIILLTLAFLFKVNPPARKGMFLVFITGLLSVITISLYKYNINHFNSVVAEQGIISCVLVVFFCIMARYNNNENVIKLLVRLPSAIQAYSGGVASVLESFAYSYAPASIILSAKRGLGVFWSILSGRYYFQEVGFKQKLLALILVIFALLLLAQG